MLFNASLEKVQQTLLRYSQPLEAESISILEAAGRISAESLYAESDIPASRQSAVDGYAVASRGSGTDSYYIVGYLHLGKNIYGPLQPGQALGVLTGGDLPDGSTAVIPHEKAEVKENILIPLEAIKPGNNIKQPGEDYAAGKPLIIYGSPVTAGHVGLLAAYGKTSISALRKPRVAILGLTRHVIPWQMTPEPGEIRDCNGPLLSALVRQDGGIPVSVKMAGRSDRSLKTIAAELLDQADILIIIGGTYTTGDNEARLLMEDLGAEILYWDVPIQPGSHTGASYRNSRMLIALSGNPAACAVGYQLFVAPVMLAMQGLIPHLQRCPAQCINGFAKKSGSRRFIRGHASWNQGGWKVSVLPGQKPSMITSLVDCNALIDVPAGSPPVEAGQDVSILLLNSLH
jgi:Molybdopterin biosynthesis enzyme